MREIKFRYWKIVEKIMLSDEQVTNYRYLNPDRFNMDVIPMQYIGLKDKNGKEIYEGDIVRYNYHIKYQDNWKGSRENEDFTGVVEYHDKVLKIGYESDETRFVGFILCGCKGTEEEYFTTIPKLEDIEVIGNIYKNPTFL